MLTSIGTFGFSQVIFQVQAPSTPVNLQATYPQTWAFGGGWSTPDLNIPGNSVTAALEFVDDGDPGLDPTYGFPANRDACSPVTNSVAGKIAVIYRGTCEFGFKARQAELSGAVGVIIINHSGPPIPMGPGDSGIVVTIPVIMISTLDGQVLESAIAGGTITQAFIGNKAGLFADDLGSNLGDVLRARRFSNIAALSQNATEFSVPVGAWVRNFGSVAQTGAQLKCVINNGSVIYADSAIIPTLNPLTFPNPADSVFVPLSLFTQASYPVGYYDMKYTITTNPNQDGEPSDNVIDASFMINDSLYSYSTLDSATYGPVSTQGTLSGNFTSEWEGCFAFEDPNASRMQAVGMTFSATTSAPVVLSNKFIEGRVYEWNDAFSNINSPNLGFASLVNISTAFYIYASDLQGVNVFVPYTAAIPLVDNKRYLFCLTSSDADVRVGYDNTINYQTTQNDSANGGHLNPSIPGSSDATYFLNGFGLDLPIAISIQMEVSTVGVDELNTRNSIVPYPNPANDELNIPVGDRNGLATLQVLDVAGKLVLSKKVSFANYEVLKLDVSSFKNGFYVGKMLFEDGSKSAFNVVIN